MALFTIIHTNMATNMSCCAVATGWKHKWDEEWRRCQLSRASCSQAGLQSQAVACASAPIKCSRHTLNRFCLAEIYISLCHICRHIVLTSAPTLWIIQQVKFIIYSLIHMKMHELDLKYSSALGSWGYSCIYHTCNIKSMTFFLYRK